MIQKLYRFLLEVVEGWRHLHWRITPPKYHPLPPTVTRSFVKGRKSGLAIEILVCQSQRPGTSKPILFMHGGFGHASVWLQWMTYLHDSGYTGTTYALSARGHGASQAPSSWLRMVFLTRHDDIFDDMESAYRHVRDREDTAPILIGHSAGGEICQYALAKSFVTAPALGLIGAVPFYGISPMFNNWYAFDPWVYLRGFFQLQHPKSSLSTLELMHNAFFGPDQPLEDTAEFMKWSADYEALGWPFGALGTRKNGIPSWLNPDDVVKQISPGNDENDKILILQGSEDVLMTDSHERMLKEYSQACRQVSRTEGKPYGARRVVIQRGGHHIQNDFQWREAAGVLLDWLKQI